MMSQLGDIQKNHYPVHTKAGMKKFFVEMETFYEKLQSFSAVNLKNAKVVPYGPSGGVTMACPTVIHHKEQKMAWFIFAFGKKNASVSVHHGLVIILYSNSSFFLRSTLFQNVSNGHPT